MQARALRKTTTMPMLAIQGLEKEWVHQRRSVAAIVTKDLDTSRDYRLAPMVSVNFGSMPFAHPVPGSYSLEQYLELADEEDTVMKKGRYGLHVRRVYAQRVSTIIDEGEALTSSTEEETSAEEQGGELKPDEESSSKSILDDNDDGDAHLLRILASAQDAANSPMNQFMTSLTNEPPKTFSEFPSRDLRILQAVIIIQRSIRCFILKMRQRKYRREIIKVRSRRRKAAVCLQRIFRGNRARILTSIRKCPQSFSS